MFLYSNHPMATHTLSMDTTTTATTLGQLTHWAWTPVTK